MRMEIKLLISDLRKRAWKNGVLFVFMCLSVTIAAAVVLMLCQLFSSITAMYETAKPPHFLQMHKGELVQSDIDELNAGFEGLTHAQTVTMIDLYGEQVSVTGAGGSYTLADCRIDLGFVKQNDGYDLLLDEKRQPLHIHAGEIAVPVILLDRYDIAIGDTVTLSGNGIEKSLTVTAYAYDGMMNSTMCSSTRFLLSDEDHAELVGKIGETEYIIEAYFTDSSLAAAYQTAYEQSALDLPKNGQAVTYTMIFLLSALTDIMTAMVFVLAGLMMMVIAVICMRYVLLAELEDDAAEIGTMKSIGIPDKSIRGLYLSKLRILMCASLVAGIALAVLLQRCVTGHISRFFGTQPLDARSFLLAAGAALVIALIMLCSAGRTLSRIRRKTLVELMVAESGFCKKRRAKSGLARSRRLPVDILMGLNAARRGYGVIFTLMFVTAFLLLVPVRSLQTMKSREFVTYMGCPVFGLMVEAEQGGDTEERNAALASIVDEEIRNGSIASVSVLRRVRVCAYGCSGEQTGVHIDAGIEAGSGIKYLYGACPVNEGQIALSSLLAEELGKSVGDTVTVEYGGKSRGFDLCGIYQDVTSGGRTAKTLYGFEDEPAEKYTYQIELPDNVPAESIAESLRARLGSGYAVESMDSFIGQTLGGVTRRIGQAVVFAAAVGAAVTALIVLLFMELRISRSARSLAGKITMGIPFGAVCQQEIYPLLAVGGAGALLGSAAAELLGERLTGGLMSLLGLGISRISFSGLTAVSAVIPVGLTALAAMVCGCVCTKIKGIDIARHFNG